MAKRKSLGDLVRSQGGEKRDDGRWQPEDGQKFSFTVLNCTTKIDKAGYPSFSLKLECTKGEDEGRSCWARFNVSEEYAFITHRLIDGFAALGVEEDDVWDNEDLVCEMVKGKTGVAVATHRESDNPNRPFINYEIEPSRAPVKPTAAPKKRKRPKSADEEEEAPTPKRAAKKKTKRTKPKPEPEPEEEDLDDEEFDDDDTFDPDDESEDEVEDDDDDETYEDEDEDDWEYETDDDEEDDEEDD